MHIRCRYPDYRPYRRTEVGVHHASAVPTQDGGSHPGATVRRVSIDAESTRVDLVLSASTPIGLLIPPIVDILARGGGFRAGTLAVRYQLSSPGGTALEPSNTLAQLGIRDGDTMVLTNSSTELMAPRFDDDAEAVSAATTAEEWRWTRRRARLVASLVTTWLAGVAATVLMRTVFHAEENHRAGCVAVAATIALLSLLVAAVACRVYREQSIGLLMGSVATGFAAMAGLLSVPGGLGAPHALFAAVAATTCAAAMLVISSGAIAFTALMAFAATAATASMVAATTAISLRAIGAGCAVISLALVEASTPLSIMFARLSAPAADLSPRLLNAKAIRARAWLTGFIAAFAAAAALGAIGAALGPFLTSEPRLPGLLFATVTGGLLLLRARAHCDLARAVPLIICGIATLSTVLVAAAAAYPRYTAHVAVVSMLLGSIALCLAVVGEPTTVSPIVRRSVELLEYLAFAVVVPLAVWLCGLYGTTRSLNLS
jgi:type VII secretion integral membrane protein EccD